MPPRAVPRVRSVTLSAEQQQLARQRVAAAGLVGSRGDRSARLPRRRRLLRRRDLGGDDRGRRIPLLADVLPDPRPAGGARWTGVDPGHHDAQPPNAGVPQHVYLDPEVHLPRRPAAVRRSDHRHHRTPHAAAHRRHDVHRPALRRDAAAVAGTLPRTARRPCPRWVSTRSSTACGSCTWPTRRPDSGRATSTCSSGPSPRLEEPDELPPRHRRIRSPRCCSCTASRSRSAVASAATTSSTSRGAWGSSASRSSQRCWVPAICSGGSCLLVLVAVWGLRLAWHMVQKSAGKGEDPRYEALLRGDFSAGHVLRKIFLIQGAATWFVSLPLQVSAVLGPTPTSMLAGFDCGRGHLGHRCVLRSGRRLPVAAVQGRSRPTRVR